MVPLDPQQLTLPVPSWKRELDLAYAAGLIDGEGTITITRRHQQLKSGRYTSYRAVVSLANTDPEMVLWMRDTFGGWLLAMPRRGPRWAHQYRWTANGRPAENCLRQVLPYLRTKAEQARLALALRDDMAVTHRRPGHRLTDADWKRREDLKMQMLDLNRKARRQFVELLPASVEMGT